MSIFDEKFSGFTKEAFRLETLSEFKVDGEWEEFQNYLKGEVGPTHAWSDWQRSLQQWTSAGKSILRLRLIDRALSPYIQFEIERYYLPHAAAGEDIRFMFKDDFEKLFGPSVQDFWLFDRSEAIRMEYSKEGEYLGASLAEAPQFDIYLRIREGFTAPAFSLQELLVQIRNQPLQLPSQGML